MKASALRSTSRGSVGGTELAVILIFCLIGLVLTFSVMRNPGMQSPEIDMVSP